MSDKVTKQKKIKIAKASDNEILTLTNDTKKTAGRQRKKTPQVIAVVTPNGIQGSLQGNQRPLIAYLPVKTIQLEEQAMSQIQYNPDAPTEPQPFDEMDGGLSFLGGGGQERGNQQTVESVPETVEREPQSDEQDVETENVGDNSTSVDIIPPPPSQQKSLWQKKEDAPVGGRGQLPCFYSEKLMVQYQDKNRLQKLPEKTDIHCFWDCHEFNGTPCVIPSAVVDGVWRVYGNFCSPNCAVAYLFSQRLDANEQWERYSKLNRLYHNFCQSPTQGISAASAREVLRIFGGSLDISEYREMLAKPTIRVDVLTPPMVSIIQSMDTKPIDFYDAALKNVFIQNDGDKLQKPGICGLRLRRSKPIREKENTLEFCMRIPSMIAAK